MSHYDEGEVRNSTKSSRHYTSKTGFIFASKFLLPICVRNCYVKSNGIFSTLLATTTFISFVLFVIDAFLCYQLALKEVISELNSYFIQVKTPTQLTFDILLTDFYRKIL